METKLDKILEVLGVIQTDVAELKTDVVVLKTRTERIEHKLDMTFEAVAYTKEEVRDSRYQLDKHEGLLAEMAKALLEQNVRIARSM